MSQNPKRKRGSSTNYVFFLFAVSNRFLEKNLRKNFRMGRFWDKLRNYF
ncbi:hypothetical protein LEP1GSC161_2339 [Leptospira santarosai str. CBC1416]|uniref:Uncharacterized protein n=2 Tax=Leptospira santarosai TaxID=28183 RepID=A0A0E2BF48_9LEPT|nr:hypothetical protein LEP1GSC179_2064 [Leptospira santarosai str. MOR084]EKR90465.1 hypothetical protein LEP1GSC163_1760 [Leptospira santarosai str. CBC379]EMO14927.1 hypothetical protein LEP1GSC165_2712 [Leptospira santarosai str. CBC523]EMO57588.1 hypothetical protein LEP1GSC161_2339 [Leptospira santarosai str. CBC1416]EMP01874.1 hypothetical protein LEP1GSC171_0336 [Leptospira santarosai str. HAI1380]